MKSRLRRWKWVPALLLSLLSVLCLAASCRKTAAQSAPPPSKPALRLWLLSTAAGALEPCGCRKDMLGGVDHAAALAAASGDVPQLLVGAGPLFFMNPELDERARTQELWKAEALADSLRAMKLVAWAPGANDWAAGGDVRQTLAKRSGAKSLAANLNDSPAGGVQVVQAGELKVGIVGLSEPLIAGTPPEGVKVRPIEAALKSARTRLDQEGANLRVALLAMRRGKALRLLESVTGFQLALIGKPFDRGEGNDAATPPVLIGETLVVEVPNHLQALARVDFYMREGITQFKDGTGVEISERRTRLTARVRELSERIEQWEKRGDVNAADLAARRAERDAASKELAGLEDPAPPKEGSFFRYELLEVKQSAGEDKAVKQQLAAYFKRVNDHNREAFKDRLPKEPAKGESRYVGVEACAVCHVEERAFWSKTQHARAYPTLVRDHKQFNLDCVGCHVTGYDEPGGSTVTHVDKLENVGCENCHGPGSRHVDDPENKSLIVAAPEKTLCASKCHHPPHVATSWSVDEAWKRILGPGHGK
ncbi:MAG: multiheme c-type cytochrome [Polyangiaceae bacterium]